jgi:hypothetical protein
MTTHDRVNGPVWINPLTLVKLPRETVERFLALFATTLDELASELAACALPWQMLPLQARPLLRIGADVVVLDEPFLLTPSDRRRRPGAAAGDRMHRLASRADQVLRAGGPGGAKACGRGQGLGDVQPAVAKAQGE